MNNLIESIEVNGIADEDWVISDESNIELEPTTIL